VIAAQASQGSTETLLSSSLLQWINADELSGPALVLKLHDTINKRKQGIVLAAADVVARFPPGATLASDDVAAENFLAAELLQAQSLRMRVAAVAR